MPRLDGGRQFCITISDTDGVSPSPDPETGEPANHMRYVVTVTNVGNPSLTHGLLTVELTDLPLGTEGVTTASLASASSSRGDVCDGLTGGGAVCDFGRLASGESFTATLGYTTSHTDGVVATRMDATASVDEHEQDNDQPDPNQEVRSASNVTEYETRGLRADLRPGHADRCPRRDVAVVALVFVARIRVLLRRDPGLCKRPEPLLQGRFLPAPDDARRPDDNQRCRADPVAASDHRRLEGDERVDDRRHSFRRSGLGFRQPVDQHVCDYDDVRPHRRRSLQHDWEPPGRAPTGVDYFVVNATASLVPGVDEEGWQAVDITSIWLRLLLLAGRIRVIGDQAGERWTSCSTPPPSLPAIVRSAGVETVIDTCVWTSENGWMK